MPEINLQNEATLRLVSFATVLVVMNLWEWWSPRRRRTMSRWRRQSSNYLLLILNSVAVRFLIPLGAAGTATWAEERSWGLFAMWDLPAGVEIVLTVVLFDLAIYGQHVMFHRVPVLWRFHRVHHADPDLDVSSGVRFHTIEILLSMLIKMGLVLALGLPVWGVIAFEVLLNATSMFNHSNVHLPEPVDRFLRLLLVTPDMHRVHHSVIRRETDSNFGFNLPWWDWLFGTYRDQPDAGHEEMTIGLLEYRDERVSTRLASMLAIPFRSTPDRQPQETND